MQKIENIQALSRINPAAYNWFVDEAIPTIQSRMPELTRMASKNVQSQAVYSSEFYDRSSPWPKISFSHMQNTEITKFLKAEDFIVFSELSRLVSALYNSSLITHSHQPTIYQKKSIPITIASFRVSPRIKALENRH